MDRSLDLTAQDCMRDNREQQLDADDEVHDVIELPDNMVVDHPSSDIVERLTEKKRKKHEEALKQMETELTELKEVCETQVKSISLELISSMQEVDLRLNTLKNRMEHLEHLEHLSLQEVCTLWEEVEEEVKLKKMRLMEMKHKLTECEAERAQKIKEMLRKCCHLLERICFLPPPDIDRLIHTKATMLNQSFLANRRSVAHLLLLLQEENLKQESVLHRHWEECLSRWRRSRVNKMIDFFRSFCSSDDDQKLVSVQLTVQQMKQHLTERCRDIISQIRSLVPPTCSTALVSDWFSEMTIVNQLIEGLHADFLHQLHCRYEESWQQRLAEVERFKEELSALQLSEEEVNNIVDSELLPLIVQRRSEEEQRLAALDLCCDTVAHHVLSLSRCVFEVMRGAAFLWETHSRRLERKGEEVQKQLCNLKGLQQKHIEREMVHLDDLLAGLRQESSKDGLEMYLDKAVRYLEDIKDSCSACVSDQCQLLDRLPSLCLDELLSYSSSLSSFYHLNHTYTPGPEELQKFRPSSVPSDLEHSDAAETQKHEEMVENGPISIQTDTDPSQPSQDLLTKAESSLLELCDISNNVIFTSTRGVAYSGPGFRCPTVDLQQETHLILFPVEVLTQALNSSRTLFLNHLEQHVNDTLSSTVAMVTDRKETVRLEQELQLKQMNPEYIQNHVYLPRLAELLLHKHRVEAHCEEALDLLASCRPDLLKLQTSMDRKNQEFTAFLSNMEQGALTANNSQRLEALHTTMQDCLDQHIKDTQSCETTFRQTVEVRLEEVRNRTTQLLSSFRLFSEGGDFSAQEVKSFQKTLREETKRISVMEQSIYADLVEFESRSLQQVKEASSRFEEKLFLLKSEMKFTEKVKKVISRTQVQIKTEAGRSNQQQLSFSSRLEDLKAMMEDTQMSPDQVCSFLSSITEDLMKRCQYLDFPLESHSVDPTSREQVQSAPSPVGLQPSRTEMDPLDDPVVDIIKSLNKFCMTEDVPAEADDRGRAATRQTPDKRLHQRSIGSTLRSVRTDRRFLVFGPEPEPEENTQSFSSKLNAVLWRANDALLLVAENFYQSECSGLGRFIMVPSTLDQWAANMQERLLGYQDQGRTYLITSREEVAKQLSFLEDLLRMSASAFISNHEQHQGVELREEVGGVRLTMDQTLAASEKEKRENIRQLQASLTNDQLQTLISREELRQQQLQSAICSLYLGLQERLRVRGEEFVTSLASLTENLFIQLDNTLTPAETEAVIPHQHSEDGTVSMETQPGQRPGSRTWSGIPYFSPPTDDLPPSVTMTTSSVTTTRFTMGHLSVIEQRDAAVKRFEQLIRSEWLQSQDNKRRRLADLQKWITHWRQQIVSIQV